MHVLRQSYNINQKQQLLPLLTREEQLKNLKEIEYDILVIGGGATGSGCALGNKNCMRMRKFLAHIHT